MDQTTESRAGPDWPVGRKALAALTDLGLDDGDLARYFHVPRADIQALKDRFRTRGPLA